MQRKLSSGKVVEKRLFHGTRKKYIDAICEHQGFDWRLCGSTVGTAYGKGSYFAQDANYSRRFAEGTEMFLVQVLVGEFTVGNKNLLRPPPKDPSKPNENLYDSCVDNILCPNMYVIFDHSQAYPEYIIQY